MELSGKNEMVKIISEQILNEEEKQKLSQIAEVENPESKDKTDTQDIPLSHITPDLHPEFSAPSIRSHLSEDEQLQAESISDLLYDEIFEYNGSQFYNKSSNLEYLQSMF